MTSLSVGVVMGFGMEERRKGEVVTFSRAGNIIFRLA